MKDPMEKPTEPKIHDRINNFAFSLGVITGTLQVEELYIELIKMGLNAEELTQLEKAIQKIIPKFYSSKARY